MSGADRQSESEGRKREDTPSTGTAPSRRSQEADGDGQLDDLACPSHQTTRSSAPTPDYTVVTEITAHLAAWRETASAEGPKDLHANTVRDLTAYRTFRESLVDQPVTRTVSDSLAVCLIHTMLYDLAVRTPSGSVGHSRAELLKNNGICFALLQSIMETPGAPGATRKAEQHLNCLASAVFGLHQAWLNDARRRQVPLEAGTVAKSAAELIGAVQELSVDRNRLRRWKGATLQALTISALTTCRKVARETENLCKELEPREGRRLAEANPDDKANRREQRKHLISSACKALTATLTAILTTQGDPRRALLEAAVRAFQDLAQSAHEFGLSKESRLIRGAAADLLQDHEPLDALKLRNQNLTDGFEYLRKMLKIARPKDEFPKLTKLGEALVRDIQVECQKTLACLSKVAATGRDYSIQDRINAVEIHLCLRCMLAVTGGVSACDDGWRALYGSSANLLKAANSINGADITLSAVRALARTAVVAHTAQDFTISFEIISHAIDALPTNFTPHTGGSSERLEGNLVQTVEQCGYTVELLASVARRVGRTKADRQTLGATLDKKIAQLGASLKNELLSAEDTIRGDQKERAEVLEKLQASAINLLINLSHAECHLGDSREAARLLRTAVAMALNPGRPISRRQRTVLVVESMRASQEIPGKTIARELQARFKLALVQIRELPQAPSDSNGGM